MLSTFLDLQNEVLAHGFDPNAYRSRVQNWLNLAQTRIARSLELPDLLATQTITTVSGTGTYAVATDLVRLAGITDVTSSNRTRLVPVDEGDYDAATPSTGAPLGYTRTEGGFVLYPTPDGAYTLTARYYKSPPVLSGDADVPAIPADYFDVMVSFALSRAYRSEDDPEQATYFWAEYQRDLAQLGSDRQYESLDGPIVAPGTWGV